MLRDDLSRSWEETGSIRGMMHHLHRSYTERQVRLEALDHMNDHLREVIRNMRWLHRELA